jgi:hypothetical protein
LGAKEGGEKETKTKEKPQLHNERFLILALFKNFIVQVKPGTLPNK